MGDLVGFGFGELSKPANTLIEKIANAVGVLYEPRRIREKAKAEAEAEKIRAVAEIEIDEFKRRALQRFVFEEMRKQENIESITGKAIPQVSNKARPEKIEDDWIVNFFDKCRLISDGEMQQLWAKILAGEANSPGKFSKKTVNIVASLDKSDAEAFTRLCGFGISIDVEVIPLVYDEDHGIYKDRGIDFFTLSNLDSIGLIKFDVTGGYLRTNLAHRGPVSYFDQKMWLEFPEKSKNDLKVGTVMLTLTGQQLATVSRAGPVAGFADYVNEKWKSLGYKTEP